MARGKVQLKRIENATSRQVTFSKRKNGLLKKAYELSILCDAEVAVIIFSQKGTLFKFASIDQIQKTIDRYRKNAKQLHTDRIDVEQSKEFDMQQLRQESANMAKKIEMIEILQRKLLGQDLDSCSPEELHDIDNQLEISLSNIRARKTQLFKEQIEQLQAKERLLLMENARLTKQPLQQSTQSNQVVSYLSSCSKSSDIVETDLYIGLPQMRCL
ncbi:MADS-box protein AGL42-like isoform X3 [Populus nigra]|uniref:MADS-box protein AGL42-like isoform X3 n=1 Tax=Populus nigra TaxID=3691 RepID=UPI002B27717C|nr:MADS-box protein AGL42-like isoform X3 [Populus nigra]